jgi:hypothetical protein
VSPSTSLKGTVWQNYTFLLWLSAAKQALVTEEDVFEAAQVIPDGLPDCLSQVADGWLEYVIRDVLAVTHEAVFGAVSQRTGSRLPYLPRCYLRW